MSDNPVNNIYEQVKQGTIDELMNMMKGYIELQHSIQKQFIIRGHSEQKTCDDVPNDSFQQDIQWNIEDNDGVIKVQCIIRQGSTDKYTDKQKSYIYVIAQNALQRYIWS